VQAVAVIGSVAKLLWKDVPRFRDAQKGFNPAQTTVHALKQFSRCHRKK